MWIKSDAVENGCDACVAMSLKMLFNQKCFSDKEDTKKTARLIELLCVFFREYSASYSFVITFFRFTLDDFALFSLALWGHKNWSARIPACYKYSAVIAAGNLNALLQLCTFYVYKTICSLLTIGYGITNNRCQKIFEDFETTKQQKTRRLFSRRKNKQSESYQNGTRFALFFLRTINP